MKKNFIIFVLFLMSYYVSVGQLEIFPIYHVEDSNPNHRARISAVNDTLSLPFVENFVSMSTSSNWISNNGVYINNHFAKNQPSVGVATLDGVNGAGTPYVFSTNKSSASGIGDYMISKCIDLSQIQVTDGLALSFFWQQGTPYDMNRDPHWNRGEQLRVYFKDKLDNFELVWPTTDIVSRILATGLTKDTFYLENIIVPPIYFHEGFQIKLEYYGTLVGNYAVFNVDNLYLDKGNVVFGGDTTYKKQLDYAFSKTPSKLLNDYSSVPIGHFKVASNDIISSTITASMYSLDKLLVQDTDSSIVIKEKVSGQVLLKSNSNSFGFNDEFKNQSVVNLTWNIVPSDIKSAIDGVLTTDNALIQTTLSVLSPDSIRTTDSTSVFTELSDYYAYDDGTMEAGLGVRGVGEFVQAFDFIKEDSIKGFYVYFPKYGLNLDNTFIKFNIYSSLEGIDGATETIKKYYQNGVVEYSTDSISSLNKFVFIPFSTPLPVNASRYYFGISQDSENRVLIGLDYSNDKSKDIYYRLFDDPWLTFASNNGYGCAAIRPSLSSNGFVKQTESEAKPSVEIQVEEFVVELFPNPSSSMIHFDKEVSRVVISNLFGQILVEEFVAAKEFNISFLDRGVYLIQLFQGDLVSSQRLIKE